MDLLYPLRATPDGSLEMVDSDNLYKLSQGRHLLATITRERILSPMFGVPIEILYTIDIPEVLTERVRMAIAQYVDLRASAYITKTDKGTIGVRLRFSTGTEMDLELA